MHGMGMDMRVWTNPEEARVLGGTYPINVLLREKAVDLRNSFHDVKALGYPILSWSQSRPAGPVKMAVAELKELMKLYSGPAKSGAILICHSRGGLIGRKYLEEESLSVRGIITLATPHHGTTMAQWAVYVSPLTSVMRQVIETYAKRDVDSALRRILRFLSSDGLKEMLPGSEFYSSLKNVKQRGIHYISAGGTSPDLVRINSVSVADVIRRIVPERIMPGEMKNGYGDGLVSSASSVMPFSDEHRNFHVNHAEILFDREVRDFVVQAVESMK